MATAASDCDAESGEPTVRDPDEYPHEDRAIDRLTVRAPALLAG
jgi:hypothetical protein